MTITKTEHFDIQRKIVANMTSESFREIPHVTYQYEPDVTAFAAAIKEANARRYSNDRLTVNTLLLKAIAEGLKAAPAMNAHISFNRHLVRGEINTVKEIDVSMPMTMPNGKMMTVNVKDIGDKSADEIASQIADLKRRAEKTNLEEAMFEVSLNDTLTGLKHGKIVRAVLRLFGSKLGKHRVTSLHGKAKKEYESIPREDRLTADDLKQGTVTVSNIGSLYREQNGATALLEIVPPQISAFALGAFCDKPVVINENSEKKIEIRTVLPICIAFDHRALDFGDIIPFLKRMDEIFASPSIVFEWMGESRFQGLNDEASA